MKPIYIVHRKKPYQYAYIDSETALRNWAEGHPVFADYRFYEAQEDRFIVAPRDVNPNVAMNATKLINAVRSHFDRFDKDQGISRIY